MRIHALATLAAAVTTLAGADLALAQGGPGVQPRLSVTAVSFKEDGSVGASASGDEPLVVGKSFTHYVFVGKAGQEGLCSTGSSGGDVTPLAALLTRAAHVWKVTATGVKYEAGLQTHDLEWGRYDAAAGLTPVASGKQRLTLAQDQTYTLDLLHNSSPNCRTASVVVEVAATAREDAALADTVLHYDLWLVRRQNGRKDMRRFVMTGRQGAGVPFAFSTLRSDIPKLQADQHDFEMVTSVAGQLRGRIRPDGQLSIELTSSRQDRLHHPGANVPTVSGFGAGRKVLELGWGEAVEIQLPSRTGHTSVFASDADAAGGRNSSSDVSAIRRGAGRGATGSSPATAPVSIQNGRLVVNHAAFFANETVSLILQVKKAE